MKKTLLFLLAGVLAPGVLCAANSAASDDMDQKIRQQIKLQVRRDATDQLLDFLKSPAAGQAEKLRSHVRYLVNHGANVNGQDSDGNRVLSLALRTGDAETVKFIIRQGVTFTNLACPGIFSNGLLSSLAHKSKCVGRKVVQEDKPLKFESDVEVAKFLRNRGEKPSMKALDAALKAGNEPLARYYVSWFGVNITDGHKRTALHEAAERNDLASVEFLLAQKGVNPSFKDRSGKQPADLATNVAVRATLKKASNVWEQDFPLHRAARSGDLARVRELLEAGADINEPLASDGRTALMEAARFGRGKVTAYLIEKGAALDVRRRTGGETALIFCVLQNKNAEAKLLVSKGADVNIQDDKGNTALHYAVKYDKPGLVQFLKKHGARTDIANAEGKTVAKMEEEIAALEEEERLERERYM